MAQELTQIEDMSFEDALAELESIVAKLERGDAKLEESITIYERGAALKAYCDAKLKAAKLKVDQIVVNPQDGNVSLTSFDQD